ncbi:MAG TPA: hypothetical protein VFZ61_11180 [Polyangiales bacterium]
MPGQREKIQELLSAPASPLRAELLRMGFDALAAEPLATLTAPPVLARTICEALTHANVERVATRHVVPGVARVTAALSPRPEALRAQLTPAAQASLRKLLTHQPPPKLRWLRNAIDPEDFRQLLAPVVQQVLLQFTTKLPIFTPGQGAGGGGLGGLVGMLGKQVQKSAGQLADVGRSVMSGLGGEFEKRVQAVARDFSQAATGEFRSALIDRLNSDEGRQIAARIRDRVAEQVLDARLGEVADDVGMLPIAEGARFSAELLAQLAATPWFEQLLETEIAGVLEELGPRSLAELLTEAGLLESARAQIGAAVEPGLTKLVASDAFGAWLDRLLAGSSQP